jgi:hypothetical protein
MATDLTEREELPASEAPRDGRRVLLRSGGLYMAAVWRNDKWMEPQGCCEIARKPTHYLPPRESQNGN